MKHLPTFRAFFLVLGFGGVSITAACGSNESIGDDSVGPDVDPPDPQAEVSLAIKGSPAGNGRISQEPDVPNVAQEGRCLDDAVEKCKKYRIELLGDTTNNIELRKKYKAALGEACYMSATNSFNCYFKTPKKACQEVLKVPLAAGAAPYQNHPTTCKQIPGTEDWSLQTGSNSSNVTKIYYEDAPLQHPLLWVDGVPMLEVNGPYRNLKEPSKVLPGQGFDCLQIDGVLQKNRIIDMNRKKNGGKIRSDLPGFMYPCTKGSPMMCTEPEFLNEPAGGTSSDPNAAQVDHVASKADPRGCNWGTNSNKNAAVVSAQLNRYFSNKDRAKEVVDLINAIPPYTP